MSLAFNPFILNGKINYLCALTKSGMIYTSIRLFTFLLITVSLSYSFSQVNIYITDVSGDIYSVNPGNCSHSLLSTGNAGYTDIAYYQPTNTIYCLTDLGGIYAVNATSGGSASYIGSIASLGNNTGMVALTCDQNGLLYIAAYNTSYVGGYLYTYDVATNTTSYIGSLPSFVEPGGDLTYLNGQMVMSSYNNQLYAIDIGFPASSTLIGTYSSTIDAFGITSINCGQNLLLSEGDQLLLMDNTTFQTTPFCSFPFVAFEINGACSTSELPIDLNLGQDTSICGIFSHTLDAGNAGSSYLWSNGATSQTIQASSPGTYWVEVTTNSCFASDTIVISSLPGPSVNLGNDTVLCTGANLTLDAQNNGVMYLWNDGSINQTLTVSTPGTYFVTINSGNCTASDTIQVQYETSPLNLGPDTEICSPIVLDAGSSAVNYLWSDGSTNQTFQANNIGTYWVDITTANCSYSDTIELSLGSIHTGLPIDTTLCQTNGNLILDAQNANASFLWQDGSTNQTYTANGAGTYWVTTSLDWCETTDTVHVFLSNPIASFDVVDTVGCGNFNTLFIDQSSSILDPIISWNWNFGDGTSSVMQNPEHAFAASGIYTVILTVTTEGGCSHVYSRNVEIVINPIPNADFSYSPIDPQVGETIFFTDQSSVVFSWFWEFGNGNNSDLQHPSFVFEQEGNHVITLVVTDPNGCSDSIQRIISLSNDIIFYIPNAFTPNGDEHNNSFHVVFDSNVDKTDFQFSIYSRWGELIFESFDPEIGWDGTFKDKPVQDGIYTWVVTFTNKENAEHQTFTGHLTVIR